jgi:hypothetical protein
MAQQTSHHPAAPDAPSLLDGASKSLGLAAAALLVLSVAYDFSFLYALGLTFEQLPTTLNDHVRSAIVWAPTAASYALFFAVYEMFMRRAEGAKTEEELIASSPNPRFTSWFRRSPAYLFGAIVGMAAAVDYLILESNRAVYILGIVAWGSLSVWLVRHPRSADYFNRSGARLFVIAPILTICVGSMGYNRGLGVLAASAPTWRAELAAKSGSNQTIDLNGIRRFTEVAVLVLGNKTVMIVPTSSILSVGQIPEVSKTQTRACRWLGLGCASPNTQSPKQ